MNGVRAEHSVRAEQDGRVSPYRRAGFTLIELLVVIAIMAILAAILVPVMATTKESARKESCEENLKQIGQALHQYRLDYGAYPPGYQDATGKVIPGGGLNAINFLQDVTSNGSTPSPRTALYPDYIKDKSIFHCPDDPINDDTQPDYYTYDYLDQYAQQNSPGGVYASTMAPGGSGAVGTAWYQDGVQKYNPNRVPVPEPPPSGSTGDPQDGRALASWPRDTQGALTAPPVPLLYPSSDTVITWCDHHRPQQGGIYTPQQSNLDDIFLFADGSVSRMTYAGFDGNCVQNKNIDNGLDIANGYKLPGCK